MLQDRIAKRYASSIYGLAKEQGKAEALLSDFQGLQQLLKESAELRSFLNMPLLTPERKAAILAKTLGGKVDGLTAQYIDVIVRRGREGVLWQIAREYVELYNIAHNRTPVEVRSVTPLSADQRKALIEKIEKEMKTTVVLSEVVDPSLIGGVVVRVGDKLYDGSIASAFRRIQKQFSDNPYIEKI